MSDYDEYYSEEGIEEYSSRQSYEEPSYEKDRYSGEEDLSPFEPSEEGGDTPTETKISDQEEDDLYTGKLNPSDYNRTGGFAAENIGVLREGGRGRYSNIYEIFISQIYITIKNSDNGQEIKNFAEDYSKKIPKERLMLLNIDVLVPALLFIASYYHKNPTSQEIENYLKKYKNVNPFDFIRYYRHIKLFM